MVTANKTAFLNEPQIIQHLSVDVYVCVDGGCGLFWQRVVTRNCIAGSIPNQHASRTYAGSH